MKKVYLSLVFLVAGANVSCMSEAKVASMDDILGKEKEVQRLANDLDKALVEQLDVAAVKRFDAARRYFNLGVAADLQGRSVAEVRENISLGQHQLSLGQQEAAAVFHRMPELMMLRAESINAGARKFFTSEFKAIDTVLIHFLRGKNFWTGAKVDEVRYRLLNEYEKLRVSSLRHGSLGVSKATLAMAENESAEKFFPLRLEALRKEIARVDRYITEHSLDSKGIQQQGDASAESAQELLHLTRKAKRANGYQFIERSR